MSGPDAGARLRRQVGQVLAAVLASAHARTTAAAEDLAQLIADLVRQQNRPGRGPAD